MKTQQANPHEEYARQIVQELIDKGYSPAEVYEVGKHAHTMAWNYFINFNGALNKARFRHLYSSYTNPGDTNNHRKIIDPSKNGRNQ